ncbi:MAG: NAD(P)/FAD-dependent oxidoreductase [Nocardioides sp.]|uniref:NAD(P)/FAD-dependent oxidoreductase n=1 Tax=Nocardioides sp. TaxID=35761 RepID=UPI003F0D8A0E
MSNPAAPATAPRDVAVVGAGMVGLATAWHLRQQGVEVTVHDRVGVAAGASWGNAGWLTPGIATPLPEPAVLRYGVKALVSPSSPLYIPPSADPRLIRFLLGFARHSTAKQWRRAMGALIAVNGQALAAFDRLAEGGVAEPTHEAKSFLAAYRTAAERATLLEEIEQIHAAGQSIEFDVLNGDDAREVEPALSGEIGAAIRLHGQRFINPGQYVEALAASARSYGVRIVENSDVLEVVDLGGKVRVVTAHGSTEHDAVVLASGAHLNTLGNDFGIKLVVQAGRGYSFSVPIEHVPSGPVYFPAQRVACTPLGDRLRVAGMMEFREPGAPLDQRRIAAITAAARPLLRGADLDDRRDEWVGSRPCTRDGLPLIGATASPRVFAAGGHGMWGITLGPVTGELLARRMVTGRPVPELAPFDPLR